MFEKWKELPPAAQWGIALFVAAAIVFGAYKMYIEEQKNTITQLEEKLADLKEEVRKGRILAAREPQLRQEIAELQLRLEELKAIIPPIRDDAQLTDKLKQLAERSSLEINRIKYNGLREEEFFKRYPIDMDVTGGYHDLAIFFDRLSRESRIFNVGGVRVSQDRRSGGTIKSTFTATTFVFKEEPEEDIKSGSGGRT